LRNAARKDMGLNVVVNTKARYMEIMRWLAHSDIAVPGAPAAAPAAPPPVDAPAEPAAPAAPDAVDRFFDELEREDMEEGAGVANEVGEAQEPV